jgi:hypothetical protein
MKHYQHPMLSQLNNLHGIFLQLHNFIQQLYIVKYESSWKAASSDTASCFVRNLGTPKRKQSEKFSRLSVMMQWEVTQIKEWFICFKNGHMWRTVTSILGDCQQA